MRAGFLFYVQAEYAALAMPTMFRQEPSKHARAARVCFKNSLIRNFGVAAPFLRHKARLSTAKPLDLFLELTKNPLGSADCSA